MNWKHKQSCSCSTESLCCSVRVDLVDDIERLTTEVTGKDEKIAFLKGELDQLANFNPDWDQLQAARDSLREHMQIIKRLTAEVSDLRDFRDKIWLECKFVNPRIDEIRRLVGATSEQECPESPSGEHVVECASGFPGFHDEPLQAACKYCHARPSVSGIQK